MNSETHMPGESAPTHYETSPSRGSTRVNSTDQYCAGNCMDAARSVYNVAREAARPAAENLSDINKRFKFLNDVAATDPHKEAEILLEHALALYELIYGQEHPLVAEIMLKLSAIYSLHGNKESAEYMTRWAREILDRPKQEPTHEFFHLFGMHEPTSEAES